MKPERIPRKIQQEIPEQKEPEQKEPEQKEPEQRTPGRTPQQGRNRSLVTIWQYKGITS